jgi:hypothetical protein
VSIRPVAHRDTSRTVGQVVILAAMALVWASPAAAQISSETGKAWNRYVAAVEREHADQRQLVSADRFLAMDFGPRASDDRRAVLSGRAVINPVEAPLAAGKSIDVPDATVHRWRGAVFLPNVTIERLLAHLENAPPADEDVLQSAVLSRGQDEMRVFMRLRRRKIVTVVYNTEHDVRFERVSALRAASTSVATRIAEVREADRPEGTEYAPGDDHGFLWRLNAYWRYQQVDGGVIAECESISLSRSVPVLLRPILGPVVNGVARESLERTLNALRTYA